MADIFLSYSREDHVRAEQIAKALTGAGYEVFWDVEIPPGKSWADVLEEKLAVCKAAIVLWSKISTASKWVREEARLAHDRGKLIPVQIDEAPPPFGFGEIQAADLKYWRGDQSDPHWRMLLSAVSAAVARPPATSATQTARPMPMASMPTPPTGSWLAPAMRGYALAGVGILALIVAIALRYMPNPLPSAPEPPPPRQDTGTATTEVVPAPAPEPATEESETLRTGVTRLEIADYLNAHGYTAKMTSDANDNKIVKTAVDGVTFNVYFYNCGTGDRCGEIQLSAGWQMPTAPKLETLNAWNGKKRLARAYSSEKGDSLYIEVDLNLQDTTSNGQIDEYLRLWKILLADFKKHFSL